MRIVILEYTPFSDTPKKSKNHVKLVDIYIYMYIPLDSQYIAIRMVKYIDCIYMYLYIIIYDLDTYMIQLCTIYIYTIYL